jgi:hypothetical protein
MTRLYSLTVEFVANRWETILPRTSDDLPARIRGRAEWTEYSEPNKACYVVKSMHGTEEYPVELINGRWHLLTWDSMGWWTRASRALNPSKETNLGLGWFDLGDPEHPDYHPLFSKKPEEESTDDPIPDMSKGKGKEVS